MAYRMLSDTNGYIPEANGIVVAHVRKEKDFAINKYVQYIPSPKTVGLYATIGRDNSVRIRNQSGVAPGAQHAWKYGADMPSGEGNQFVFQMSSYQTQRYALPWQIDYGSLEQTTLFKPKLLHMRETVSQMMTLRSLRTVTTLTTTTANAPWPTSHVVAANTLNNGKGTWPLATSDPSDPNGLAIFRTLQNGYMQIHLDTNGNVKMGDVRTLISPFTAIDIAQSAELQNYVKENTQSVIIMKEGFEPPTPANNWGLPTSGGKPTYRGFEFVVEDAMYVNEYVKTDSSGDVTSGFVEATTNRLYMWPADKAVMLTRQGTLDGEYGQKSYSTYCIYHHGGLLKVKAKDDDYNEIIRGAVVEEVFESVPAPYSGMLITGIR